MMIDLPRALLERAVRAFGTEADEAAHDTVEAQAKADAQTITTALEKHDHAMRFQAMFDEGDSE